MPEININPGELHVSRDEGDTIIAKDLCGSLVVAMHDPTNAVGAMAYIMLPQAPPGHEEGLQFAATAIPRLLNLLIEQGAAKDRIAAKLVGASCLIASGVFSIGKRNVAKAREVLGELGLAIAGEDTGGSHKRNVRFDIKTGKLTIENIAK
ncbi:MAG: chemotaxis protein CheD [Nitrospinae bacterium]|nr:chemotaxis protein CheD [Nitrospinota bacterium]